MQQLASRTGGRVLSFDDPASLFDLPASTNPGPERYRAIWAIPLGLSLLLVLLELAWRYGALQRLGRWRHPAR